MTYFFPGFMPISLNNPFFNYYRHSLLCMVPKYTNFSDYVLVT